MVFFIPSIKINFYLKQFKKYLLLKEIFLLQRELSKMHETFYRSSVDDIESFNSPLKGELTIVISNKLNIKNKQNSTINLNLAIKRSNKIFKKI